MSLILSCREQALMPKPDGYFRIEFNKPNYNKFKKTDSKSTFYLNKNETTEIDFTCIHSSAKISNPRLCINRTPNNQDSNIAGIIM